MTDLADYTTLGLGGPAKNFVAAVTEADLIDAVRAADAAATKFFAGPPRPSVV